jgi:thioredoxin 1
MTYLNMLIAISCLPLFFSCTQAEPETQRQVAQSQQIAQTNVPPKITFVELGSVNCIPCRQMQPIMQSIEKKYGNQVRVVFHDVWKDPAPGQKYRIRLIPTQIFLDENGLEIARHEGFLPEADIDGLFEAQGLKILEGKQAQ